jgi:hypothetical protein
MTKDYRLLIKQNVPDVGFEERTTARHDVGVRCSSVCDRRKTSAVIALTVIHGHGNGFAHRVYLRSEGPDGCRRLQPIFSR